MIPWHDIAVSRGYKTVREMMEAMYPKFSLAQLAQRFGCSIISVRTQIDRFGIEIQGRGGNKSKPKLAQVTMQEWKAKGARALAQEHAVDVTTVYKHFRKREALEEGARLKAAEGVTEPQSPENESAEGSDHAQSPETPAPEVPQDK